jgi:serine/threonine protein phosphatase 1
MRTFLIGDIHGCYAELLDLLEKAGLSGDDRIIALGDIVDRGPETPQVLEFFQSRPGALSLMGNHERKHIRWSQGEVKPALSQQISKEQLGQAYPDALTFMETFPIYLELPEAILVHGCLEPGVPLEEQRVTVVCGTMSGERYLAEQYDWPWYELYRGEKPVIFAHYDFLRSGKPFIYQDRLFGLDTSCVHGGRLTGLLLPGFTFVSVPSRSDHWSQIRQILRAQRTWEVVKNKPSPSTTPWDEASEQALADLLIYVQKENERILVQLQADPEFTGLRPRQQAKAYAALVRGSPIERLLHLARTDELDVERARRALGFPEQVWAVASKLSSQKALL